MGVPKWLEAVSPAAAIVGSFINKKRSSGSSAGRNPTDPSDPSGGSDASASPSSFRRGGKVKKGGRAKVHKNERVLTAKQNKKYQKMKRAKRGSKR